MEKKANSPILSDRLLEEIVLAAYIQEVRR
jgi:hypothetical protein